MQHSTLYLPRDSGLHRLHPLTTLCVTLLAFALSVILPESWQVLSIYLLGTVPLAAWGRMLPEYLKLTGRLILPFAVSLFLIQGFFAPGEQVLLRVLGFTMTLEGLQLAGRYAARILVWLGAAVLFMISTRPDRFVAALIALGIPHQLGYIILTALQIIPQMRVRALTILDAQRARGLETEGRLLSRLNALVPLVGPLLLSSIIELDRRAVALEARGFKHSGTRTSYAELNDSPAQARLRLLLLASIPVAATLRLLLR